jgi:phosphoribosyl 1,2-cyclic phosphodiesterase
MIGYCPLASGSSGNSIFLGTKNSKILIDAGISCKRIVERLETINLTLHDIDAIFVTHEHTDHIAGLKTIVNQYNIPIIANSETARGIYNHLMIKPKFKIFSSNEEFTFQDLEVFPFSVSHDTLDPVGFVIKTDDNNKIGICTDLGFVTSFLKAKLKNCNYLYVEANHNPNMVMATTRPIAHKQRVLGRCGHLSNEECANLLKDLNHEDLRHVFLAHLSGECNSPEKVLDEVTSVLKKNEIKMNLSVAFRDKISEKIYFK